MGTFVTLIVLIAVVWMAVAGMVKDKRKGKSLQCGMDCKNCKGHCH